MATAEFKLLLTRRRWRLLAMALLMAAAPVLRAQDVDRDPPSRAARVVEVVGDAWLFDTENREWVRVTRNQTVGEGDRVRTDERSRVSLRVGSTSIWVDERSDLELTALDEGHTLLQIDRGDVAVRLRNAQNAAETQLRTREGTAQPEREGLYRVEQLDRGSKAYVWQGRLRFDWARGAPPVTLVSGEEAEFWWPDGPRAERNALRNDGFGDWVVRESREEGDLAVARYVSPEMTGAEDLDRYGRWETTPDYGAVWIPTTLVVADWAPYRYGRWTWSRLWGWTWVDDAPWGFAPFHYGRWVNWGGRWCWAPGPYVQRPVYAPALVGWIGGPGISVGVTIGSRPPPPRFGWYPLAPREVYVPSYRHTPRYVSRINDPRDLRDPVTVKRPNRYRDVPAAVSTLPAPGAAIQPLPVRGPDRKPEPGWGRPLPGAPGRGDLAAVLPPAPVRPPQTGLPLRTPRGGEGSDGSMGWRSESQLPQRRERAERFERPDRADRAERPERAPMPQPQPVVPGGPQSGLPVLPQQPQPQRPNAEPQRGGDTVPWRQQAPRPGADAQQPPQRDGGPQRDWQQQREERQLQQQREQQQDAQLQQEARQQREAQQRDQQQREAQQRAMQQREAQQREMQQRELQQRQQREQQVRELQQRELQQRRAEQPRIEQPAAQRPQDGPGVPQRERPDRTGPRRGGDEPRAQER